jgi:hypothetical protein
MKNFKLPKYTKEQKTTIAITAAVGIAAYLMFKKSGSLLSSVKKFTGQATTEDINKSTTEDIKTLNKQGVKPTYYASQYVLFADKLYNAMITSNPFQGTDEDAIYSVMRLMKNDVDINMLVKAFGTRRMEFSLKGGGLAAFLEDDLDKKELAIVNKILSDNEINYRF